MPKIELGLERPERDTLTGNGTPRQFFLASTARLETFSDGVFAIAITLLVLELHVPEWDGKGSLSASLFHEWTHHLAFLIGFFTILICWINHHFMFTMIHRSNSALILVNGFKLLVVTFTPFATGLLSKNLQTAWESAAVTIYCFNFLFMGLAMTGVWWYAQWKDLMEGEPDLMRGASRLYILSSVFPLVMWLVSYFSITACLVFAGVMFAVFIFPERSAKRLGRTRGALRQ